MLRELAGPDYRSNGMPQFTGCEQARQASSVLLLVAAGIATIWLSTSILLAQTRQQEPADPSQAAREPDVDFIPTPHDVAARMLEMAAVKKDDVLFDLGCGDGRILISAAQRYGCRAVGVDIDPKRVKQSRENVKKARLEKLVRVEEKDLFKTDLREADVVTLYLSTKLNARLLPQLKTLKPGARVVSHQFGIPGVKPDKVMEFKSRYDGRIHTLYLWTAPLDIQR
jgi:SAM-dependent methyltransferase